MSQAGSFNTGVLPPGGGVETITGNSGGAVGPDGANNINVIGDGTTIDVVGNPGTNTLTVSLIGGEAANSFPTDSGTAIPSSGILNITAGNSTGNSGRSVKFTGSGNTATLNVTDVNNNTLIGSTAGNASLSGSSNAAFGQGAMSSNTTGGFNTVIGAQAGHWLAGWLTGINPSFNTLIGFQAGIGLDDGAGESNNILIGAAGSHLDNNTLRIGNGSGVGAQQLNKAYISGIAGVNVGSVTTVVTESGDQLGTAVITAGTGITITPGANLITIATTALTSAITSITGDTGGAQSGPAITLAGGTTGLSFGGSANTITTTFAGITANGGSVLLATDATTSTINVGTGAGVKNVTLGSVTSTSATTVRSGSGALNITSTNGAITMNSGTGTVGICTDNTTNTLNIGTTSTKAITLGSTNVSATTLIRAGGGITINTGANNDINISSDAFVSNVNIGTGTQSKIVTLGSTNTHSSTTIQSGDNGITIASSGNGIVTITAGTGGVSISDDASAASVTLGTGGAVKTVTVGSINTTSSTTIQSGTGGITIGTGAQAKTVAVGSTTGASALTLNSGTAGIITAGVYNKTIGATTQPLLIDNTGLLGTVISSRRFKQNINPMADESSAIYKLNPVTFTLISDKLDIKQYGLIAEDVSEAFPALAMLDDEGNPYTVRYHDLPVLLLNEIKKLNARIATLEAKL